MPMDGANQRPFASVRELCTGHRKITVGPYKSSGLCLHNSFDNPFKFLSNERELFGQVNVKQQ